MTARWALALCRSFCLTPGLRGLSLGSRVWPLQGRPLPVARRRKVQALVSSGARLFVNLMEEGETNHAGDPFVPYAELTQQLYPDIACVRNPIRDQSVPTQAQMRDVLDTIDHEVQSGKAVYVHCWGGVRRTGTVVGCWLLRHRLADASNVLDVLRLLRQQDQERGQRMSPETPAQRRFGKRPQA